MRVHQNLSAFVQYKLIIIFSCFPSCNGTSSLLFPSSVIIKIIAATSSFFVNVTNHHQYNYANVFNASARRRKNTTALSITHVPGSVASGMLLPRTRTKARCRTADGCSVHCLMYSNELCTYSSWSDYIIITSIIKSGYKQQQEFFPLTMTLFLQNRRTRAANRSLASGQSNSTPTRIVAIKHRPAFIP